MVPQPYHFQDIFQNEALCSHSPMLGLGCYFLVVILQHYCSILMYCLPCACSIISEQCCKTTLKVILCNKGIQMAQQQQPCEMSFFEDDIPDMCCDCCSLGLKLSKQEIGCNLQDLSLGEQCRNVALSCCNKNNTAEDLNECQTATHNCTHEETCVNNNGSFVCLSGTTCKPGFELTVNNTCKDIDECASATHTCGSDLVCTNTEGSFDCIPKDECAEGFIKDTKRACVGKDEELELDQLFYLSLIDIDECETGHVCGTDRCVNVIGSYRCECQTGFTFNQMAKVCEDINECMNSSVQHCAQNCENTRGSFKCSCSTGFNLAHNNRSCEGTITLFGIIIKLYNKKKKNIDECAAETHSCSTLETCFNVQGGFHCLYFHCPQNFETSCTTRWDLSLTVRCVKDCQPEDMICHGDPVHIITHSVLILPITEQLHEPQEIIMLRTITPAHQVEPDPTEVFFAILSTDAYLSFDVVKRTENGMIVGVVRQVKPIHSPKDIVLEVGMNYVKSGVVSYRNYVLLHVFISKYLP
uniref:Fibulin-1 n=1 Tax=Gouania willdenowi TaxID=441366 RepID=A0A8C5NF54_GOUWI